jgi:hypothetical protein
MDRVDFGGGLAPSLLAQFDLSAVMGRQPPFEPPYLTPCWSGVIRSVNDLNDSRRTEEISKFQVVPCRRTLKAPRWEFGCRAAECQSFSLSQYA